MKEKTLEEKMWGNTPKEIYMGLIDLMEFFQRINYMKYLTSDNTKESSFVFESSLNGLSLKIKNILISEKEFFLKDVLEENLAIVDLYGLFDETFEVFKDCDALEYKFYSEKWRGETEQEILLLNEEKIKKLMDEDKKNEEERNKPSLIEICYPESIKEGDSWD